MRHIEPQIIHANDRAGRIKNETSRIPIGESS
jgi:hypothetical protein